MKGRTLCIVMLGLWVVTLAAAGWMFVKGWTAPGSDERTAIVLAPAERDQILAEMRQFLKAIQGVVSGMSDQNPAQAEEAARGVGLHMEADVDPALILKLPLAFKQMGMSIHRDMDTLADGIHAGASAGQILGQMAGIMSRCTTCHDFYRFSGQ